MEAINWSPQVPSQAPLDDLKRMEPFAAADHGWLVYDTMAKVWVMGMDASDFQNLTEPVLLEVPSSIKISSDSLQYEGDVDEILHCFFTWFFYGPDRAVESLEKVYSESKCSVVAANLGVLLARGVSRPTNLKLAIDYFEFAVAADVTTALYNLGVLLEGLGGWKNLSRANYLFHRGAAKGHILCQFKYATMCQMGLGCAVNTSNARIFHSLAVEANFMPSVLNLALLYESGSLGVDNARMGRYILRLNVHLNKDYLFDLGRLYYDSKYAPDFYEARRWWFEGHTKGCLQSRVAFADMLMNGEGGSKDTESAMFFYESAADCGNCPAMKKFALCLAHSPQLKMKHLKKYIGLVFGDSEAMFEYGMLRLPLDYEDGLHFISESSKFGHAEAVRELKRLDRERAAREEMSRILIEAEESKLTKRKKKQRKKIQVKTQAETLQVEAEAEAELATETESTEAEPDKLEPEPLFIELQCPITLEDMVDPVCTIDGQTYERRAIEAWFEKGNDTSPLTGKKLDHLILIPNITVRQLCNGSRMVRRGEVC